MLIIFDLDDTLFARLPDNYSDEDIQSIKPFPGVVEFLTLAKATKVLVTKGNPGFQNKKIDILAFRDLFDKVMICQQDQEKKECFQKALRDFHDNDIWVVGDRINSEIRWGNELGFKTVWFKQGKYQHLEPRDGKEVADYVITEFSQLTEVIK
jgi:putative hydrolase of the HAD superfamily